MVDDTEFYRQTHQDVASLSERVNSVERVVTSVEARLEQLSRDTSSQIRNVSESLMYVSKDLSTQIQAIALTSAGSSTTNWGNVATIAGVLLVFAGTVIAPIVYDLHNLNDAVDKFSSSTIERFERVPKEFVPKDEYKEEKRELAGQLSILRDKDKDFVEKQQYNELKEHLTERFRLSIENQRISDDKLDDKIKAVDGRVTIVDGNQVKRPEIIAQAAATSDHIDNINKALGERITSLANALTATQNQLQELFVASYAAKLPKVVVPESSK